MLGIFRRSVLTVLDAIGLSIAYWLAFLFRFEFAPPHALRPLMLFNLPVVVGIPHLALYALGVPRLSWRYMTMRDTVRVGIAITLSASVLLAIRTLAPMFGAHELV